MDGEQIVRGGVLGSSMVPILSREIFAVLKWLRVWMSNVGVDLGLFANTVEPGYYGQARGRQFLAAIHRWP